MAVVLTPRAYTVEARLGQGGMGVVDLATGPDGTRVALKRLALPGSAESLAASRARLRREADVLRRLDHPRIVRLLDVLDDGDDVVLVMPWLRGGSLADRVARRGPLPPEEVGRLADHLLGALAAAHRAGVVHRDIKPANILFDAESRPHLADFGVATARDVTAGLTTDGHAVGTPSSMAPELARGEAAGPAADVFGLGATLRFAATGAGPWGTGEPDVLLWRAASGRLQPWAASVPAPLRTRIDAMLRLRPERRPSAAALAGGPDGTDPRRPARPGRQRPVRTAALAALGAVAVAGVIAATVHALRTPGDAAVAQEAADGSSCTDLPYQPCGRAVAPGTDGHRCIDERADYDGDAANGCEAVPDAVEGTALGEVEATIVPASDVDEFPVEVRDHFHLSCDGRIAFDLTAPTGMSLRLQVLDRDGDVLGEVTSADGTPAQLRLAEPRCLGDDATTLAARITPVGTDRVAAPYQLSRTGSW
jgi:hypothetical protein